MKRHWRILVARYGAYPTIWIIGGESGGPEWTEVARYVQKTDPYRRPSTIHPFDSGRKQVTDETVINFDMLQTGHGDWEAARGAIPKLKAAYDRKPPMPVMIGEYCYEGHMQTAFPDVQRYVFWGSMLSGSAGLTYGAAGVWHACVAGDPGLARVYDWTTWKEGMRFPGSTQWDSASDCSNIPLGAIRAASGMDRARLLCRGNSERSSFHLHAQTRVGGVHGITVTIAPFRYDPAENQLTSLKTATFRLPLARIPTAGASHSALFTEYLNGVFVNFTTRTNGQEQLSDHHGPRIRSNAPTLHGTQTGTWDTMLLSQPQG